MLSVDEFPYHYKQGVANSILYYKTSNISPTSLCNKIVDHLDVVGVSPVRAAPTTSSYLT